ncbi:MAG: secondary thiamine-phosphate synthase enzyme YjbQ [bacterium]
MIKTLTIATGQRQQMVDVTAEVQRVVSESGVASGMAICFVTHTTAAVTINENADPSVRRDILHKLDQEIPQADGYHHAEGNSDAHVKSTLVGASEQILIEAGHLLLGTWQGIYFCEFDGPRQRRMVVKVASFD